MARKLRFREKDVCTSDNKLQADGPRKVGVRHWMGATPADREEAAAGLVTRP